MSSPYARCTASVRRTTTCSSWLPGLVTRLDCDFKPHDAMSDLNIATSLRCDASGCDVRYIARCLPPTLALHYRPSHRLLVDQSDNRSFARFPSTTSKVMTLGWFCSQSVLFGSISDIARCIAHRIDDCDGTVTSHRSMRFGTDIAIATSLLVTCSQRSLLIASGTGGRTTTSSRWMRLLHSTRHTPLSMRTSAVSSGHQSIHPPSPLCLPLSLPLAHLCHPLSSRPQPLLHLGQQLRYPRHRCFC